MEQYTKEELDNLIKEMNILMQVVEELSKGNTDACVKIANPEIRKVIEEVNDKVKSNEKQRLEEIDKKLQSYDKEANETSLGRPLSSSEKISRRILENEKTNILNGIISKNKILEILKQNKYISEYISIERISNEELPNALDCKIIENDFFDKFNLLNTDRQTIIIDSLIREGNANKIVEKNLWDNAKKEIQQEKIVEITSVLAESNPRIIYNLWYSTDSTVIKNTPNLFSTVSS